MPSSTGMSDKYYGKNQHDPLEGLTPDGIIVTGAHTSRIVAEFKPVLDEAVERLSSFGEGCSLYVYGSVANGTASVGHSDVDLISLGLDSQDAQKLGEALSKKFSSLCRSVEVGAGHPMSYDSTNDESYGNRVFLRHYCVHLTGPDVRANLPDFPSDERAARGFNGDIGIQAETWRAELPQAEDLVALARRMGRKTLYAVGSLVSIHDHTWTTNRAAAAQRWGDVRPEIAEGLCTLLEWSNGATPRPLKADVINMLDEVVGKVVDDFNKQIGLWNPQV